LLLGALAMLGTPSLAHAEEAAATSGARAAAQEAYRHALELFDRGEHAAALAEFQRANDLSPSFRILYNIGLTQAALGNAPAAVAAYSQYLHDGGTEVPAARRQSVTAEIQRLSAQLVGLTIEVEEPGAELSIDGEVLGRGPLSRQVRLNLGRHTVNVRSPDGTLKTQTLTLTRGEEQRLRFRGAESTSAPSAAAPAPEVGSSPPPESHQARGPVPWLAWGVTGALGVAAGVTGVVALGAHGDQLDLKKRDGVTPAQLSAADDKVTSWALASDILLAGSAVAAGVSLYLTLRTSDGAERDTALMLGPGGVTFSQRF
jgi:hypothetical protein